jgi:hypothetical protein
MQLRQFYQQIPVLVEKELLELLPIFLIASDRNQHMIYQQGRSSHQNSNFVVPRIQVSYWSNTVGGNIPTHTPPSGTPKGIPPEIRPSQSSRQQSRT